MKSNYTELSAYEKLKRIQKLNFCRVERHNVAVYLNALRRNDRTTIDEYESFGDTPYQFLLNKRCYDRQLLFGFTEKRFNEYGWLRDPVFFDVETVEWQKGVGWLGNYIMLGRGSNGKWTYGVTYSYSTGGSSRGLSVWGKIFNDRAECLKHALNEMVIGLQSNSDECKYARATIKQVQNFIKEITTPTQLSIFETINECERLEL